MAGNKAEAFEMFLADETSNKDVTFERFCELMEKTVARFIAENSPQCQKELRKAYCRD